ncbi:DUF2189 domain-containing protein [Aliiglaciecola sp. 3_MG-2023]|uniref:DUF2189 domain-containing protein n=1 Tax=Aliiglaciecola sp. 3_MG-2023 TaxID=3062644 RepID=UPI0026E3043A|nr:DUF2189 domain-containing protein [Aliiglaciecola sp. 3_MG-2023]MDO6692505.1 DUF2189 domain-containing protein [Aliiglaciecola sp. 3_MG-2023]
MSQHFQEEPHNAITDSSIARVIPCNELAFSDPFKWLALGFRDLLRAPILTVFFGVFFALIPWVITYLVALTGWHLVILPAMVCFMLIGPFLAAGLYDISWEFGKGHKPTLWHAVKAVKRNAVNEWGFGILLMVLMIFWLRVASMIHALYPSYLGDNLEELLPFLVLGTCVGAVFTGIVFLLSAFTQPILMERKVDLATAVLTTVNAVWLNKGPMFVWAMIIFVAVVIGFLTGFVGFVLLMPLIGYATWHGYIETIQTKRERKFE